MNNGSSSTEISEIARSPKLRSERTDHRPSFVEPVLTENMEAASLLNVGLRRCTNLYTLELLSASMNPWDIDRTDRMETMLRAVAVVLIEVLSSATPRGGELAVANRYMLGVGMGAIIGAVTAGPEA
jgi:hypothetical protein